MGLPKSSAALLRRLRYEGGKCGSGKLPAGSAVLLRRGLVRRKYQLVNYSNVHAWCLYASAKKRRSK